MKIMKVELVILLALATLLSLGAEVAVAENCSWDKEKDFPKPSPLIFDSNSKELIRPVLLANGTRFVKLEANAEVILSCPGRKIPSLGVSNIPTKCLGGKKVAINTEIYELKSLNCSDNPRDEIIKLSTEVKCGDSGNGVLHNIGFQITKQIFYEKITVCFDHRKESTLYVNHTIKGKYIESQDKNDDRPSFKTDKGFFTISISPLYTQKSQKKLFKNLLGENKIEGEKYLAKGHLTPDADNNLHDEAEATYYYANVVPQFQSKNNGNWKGIETSIRKLAIESGKDYQIWTGTHDVLTLFSESKNKNVSIYLGLADKLHPQEIIPVPALMWKVVYDPVDSKGVAFISVNNPFIEKEEKEICINVCKNITWITLSNEDLEKGQSYCCEIHELKKSIPNIPDLKNVDLLSA